MSTTMESTKLSGQIEAAIDHTADFPVHRLTSGTIDYDFYRAEARQLRDDAIQSFWRATTRWAASLAGAQPSSAGATAKMATASSR